MGKEVVEWKTIQHSQVCVDASELYQDFSPIKKGLGSSSTAMVWYEIFYCHHNTRYVSGNSVILSVIMTMKYVIN